MEFTDQTGFTIDLDSKPERIISIVPSQSELLWDLGLRDQLVGITKFCIHPDEMFRSKERVGGTKKLNIEKIRALKPDLIIGNKEENEKSQIEELRKEFKVWMSDIYNLEDAYAMMMSLGKLCDKENEAKKLTGEIKNKFKTLDTSFLKDKRTAYFIWYDPLMVAASNTFIDFILNRIGLINVFSGQNRYPELTTEQIKEARPELILLSSEPFPFKQKHVDELQAICPDAKILLVDGELFSWYGSRLRLSPQYFNSFYSQ
jgi:ABC-type Fe3+-hydroxamate transport system substrate-binding protein